MKIWWLSVAATHGFSMPSASPIPKSAWQVSGRHTVIGISPFCNFEVGPLRRFHHLLVAHLYLLSALAVRSCQPIISPSEFHAGQIYPSSMFESERPPMLTPASRSLTGYCSF
ncbi:MAG: hypothetical protein JGK17_05580 [Microcoleus sp. PH2017_10_PVI_O_A]|uniref:hypothetical protein n=1 Tax=unclassified Microcoleus TaxID=2642155 RepID=UPI001DE967CA|nr:MULTISPECIES: hypothetical protein [unclassified Microcoleus]TAE85613.1 MAG: hypothetical protein EAZ83_01705 [Oscillatoriales cyanobacterium]MCC3405057.1 hypothetical protein [Microcoleus sp. PH2017_10_PVI_O_A]MCC3459138.1 hypothetical protein [Microcoleus sp. PH2017_11_PCY_U_A]MCC3477195.1 hypothetical protein [Microcoleus sp. PH2017_12_PCY_D_A]MCC3530748.1 hypothetical protein [Microcoleus sp. PH2017_21_RUC_O_A]